MLEFLAELRRRRQESVERGLLKELEVWSARLAQQVDPVAGGPGAQYAVAPERIQPAAEEVRRILSALERERNG